MDKMTSEHLIGLTFNKLGFNRYQSLEEYDIVFWGDFFYQFASDFGRNSILWLFQISGKK